MKKLTTLLILATICMLVLTTPLIAKEISYGEFYAKTGIAIEDLYPDDPPPQTKDVKVEEFPDRYVISVDGITRIVFKEQI